MNAFEDGLVYLMQMDTRQFVVTFWHMFLFELPRYTIAGLVAAGFVLFRRKPAPPIHTPLVTVLLVGHNESDVLPRIAASLRDQTYRRIEILVVDDGSTDDTTRMAMDLRRDGMIDTVLRLPFRGGKSAAANFGLRNARGDIVVYVDADTTFDIDAIEHLVARFDDPRIGAVSGNLGVRNRRDSVLSALVAVQFLVSINLGRCISTMFDILFIVSGAHGAFRKAALESVGGWEVGPGDDSDLTAKLRRAGWRVVFAPEAWTLTDMPTRIGHLLNQRMRWNRSLVRVRIRKFGNVFNPANKNFSLLDAIGIFDILFFQIALSVAFVIYLGWLFVTFGTFAFVIIFAVMLIYTVIGLLSFFLALAVANRPSFLSLLPYACVYGVFNGYFLRTIRLVAVVDEFLFKRSFQDDFVPKRVRDAALRDR